MISASMCEYVYVFMSVSLSLSVCLSFCLSVCLSVCMYVSMYVWMCVYACLHPSMYGLVFLTCSTYLEPQELVIFKLQMCPINHKTCRAAWNLVVITLWNIFTHNSHFLVWLKKDVWRSIVERPFFNIKNQFVVARVPRRWL